MSHTLGIDIGTFEAKGVIVDGQGTVVASAARQHRLIVPQTGFAEHRAIQDWWEGFCELSRRLLAESGLPPSAIKAVGTSAIGPCMLPVGRDGEPLMNAVLYGVDTRSAAEVEELTEAIGADTIFSRCGNALTTQSIGPKILWLARHRPKILAETAMIHGATSFLVHRLTGEAVMDHYTAANLAPLYDADGMALSDHLQPELLPLDRLPRVAWTTEIAGTVTQSAADATGLEAGTPVIVGTIDAAAEAVSVGVAAPGEMMLMYGSTMFMIMVSSHRLADPRLWWAPWLFPNRHAAMAGLSTSGTLTHWFRDQLARELDPATALPALAAEAEQSPPGARGLVALPYFSGERTPIHDPKAKGALLGLTLAHTRADIYRAVLEGIAHGTNHVLDTYAEAGERPRSIFAVGGGTRNRVWAQSISDITARPQILRQTTIGAAFGDAFLAALAIGAADERDIGGWNPVAGEIRPDPSTTEVHLRNAHVYRALYPATRSLMHQLG